MADFSLAGLSSGRSPDRLDAMVYAVTELVVKPQREPRIRSIGSEMGRPRGHGCGGDEGHEPHPAVPADWGIPDEDQARTVFVSADVFAVVTPPFADTEEGERLGEFRAWLDGFIEGGQLTVCENPDLKPYDTMLARVHPVEAEFWSIRVTEPETTPGIRSFGAFSFTDEFVALTWSMREAIGPHFNDEVDAVIALWGDHFGNEHPHKGDTINDYLTVCTPV